MVVGKIVIIGLSLPPEVGKESWVCYPWTVATAISQYWTVNRHGSFKDFTQGLLGLKSDDRHLMNSTYYGQISHVASVNSPNSIKVSNTREVHQQKCVWLYDSRLSLHVFGVKFKSSIFKFPRWHGCPAGCGTCGWRFIQLIYFWMNFSLTLSPFRWLQM